MRAVVDTNVWVSALIIPESVPRRVLIALREGRFDVVVSWELVDEVVRVLRRPKIRRYAVDESQIEELVRLLTPMLPTVEYDVPVRDPKDAPVVAAALSGNAEVIVSGDADLLDDASLRAWLRDNGVEVVTAVEFLELLR